MCLEYTITFEMWLVDGEPIMFEKFDMLVAKNALCKTVKVSNDFRRIEVNIYKAKKCDMQALMIEALRIAHKEVSKWEISKIISKIKNEEEKCRYLGMTEEESKKERKTKKREQRRNKESKKKNREIGKKRT